MKPFELKKLQIYLNSKFDTDDFIIKEDIRNNSCEVYLKNEFIGLIYKDDEDGELSFQFHMTILDEDLIDA